MNKIIRWYNHTTHQTDRILDSILNRCVDSGIAEYKCNIEHSYYRSYCKFNNGWEYEFWNTNIPFGWLSKGEIKKHEEFIYRYDDVMPRKRTMNRFYNAIYEYIEKEITK